MYRLVILIPISSGGLFRQDGDPWSESIRLASIKRKSRSISSYLERYCADSNMSLRLICPYLAIKQAPNCQFTINCLGMERRIATLVMTFGI